MKKLLFLIIILSVSVSGCSLGKQQPVDNKLNLSGQELKNVPSYVFEQTDLEELDISNNQITGAIPAELRNLKKLKVLKASGNLMTGIPAEIGQLPALELFDISRNFIAGVPKEIGLAQNLKTLDLSNNQLTGLPYELGNLQGLQTLNVSGNSYTAADLDVIMGSLSARTEVIK